jgi:arabinogalactan endo-1,4-beta-galactosidase
MQKSLQILLFCFSNLVLCAQGFYFGADLSYVNEMEDCGVSYFENGEQKDPYAIFENHGCNLVRLRLWHSPAWYDTLNGGERYSDLSDVKQAIARAKQQNMAVLLDFHLSDNWADPNKQLVPLAWLPVVDNLEILKDSLYNYLFATLTDLKNENLLPEMIQIGNETNKGILLSPEDNAVWTLDWDRNATLFNHALQAVSDFETQTQSDVKTVLHVAGPANAEWLMDGFVSNGVTDFDIIGLSYYWAWHMPTEISDAGSVIQTLKNLYPNKEVMVVETGYIWTNGWNDNASNIITETHADYQPVSPEHQKEWLVDLTQEVIHSGGKGVIYWEPCWVSSTCFTQWGQGSHQEHAAFFDFDNQLLLSGGITWMEQAYDFTTSVNEKPTTHQIQILANSFSGDIKIKQFSDQPVKMTYSVADALGHVFLNNSFTNAETSFRLIGVPFGMYFVSVVHDGQVLASRKVIYSDK